MKQVLLITFLILLTETGFAQISSRDNAVDLNESWRTPMVRGGYPAKRFPKARISGEKPAARDIGGKKNLTLAQYNKIMDRKIEEFYQRMQAEVREDKLLSKILQRPQYSDPSFFGHKRRPHKRAVGKRKFCKECGIVH